MVGYITDLLTDLSRRLISSRQNFIVLSVETGDLFYDKHTIFILFNQPRYKTSFRLLDTLKNKIKSRDFEMGNFPTDLIEKDSELNNAE